MSNIIDFNKAKKVYQKIDVSNVDLADAMLPQNFMIASTDKDNKLIQNSVKFLSETLEVDVNKWIPLSSHNENAGFIIGKFGGDDIELYVVALITPKSLSWHLADKDLIKRVQSKLGNVNAYLFEIFYDEGFDVEFRVALNMQKQMSDSLL